MRSRLQRRRRAAELPPQAMAIAIVGRPPAGPTGESTLVQLLLSLAVNLLDASNHRTLVVPANPTALARLRPLLAARPELTALRLVMLDLLTGLRTVSPSCAVDLEALPETFQRLLHEAKPDAWSTRVNVKDIGRYTSLYRSIHAAVALRYATRELGAEAVLLLRPESYLWRPVSLPQLLSTRNQVWYADHRGRWPATPESPPTPDTASRGRVFCSMHPWVGPGGTESGGAAEWGGAGWGAEWGAHSPRFAVGRSWAAWDNLTRSAGLLPAPDADFAAEPMQVFTAAPFDVTAT